MAADTCFAFCAPRPIRLDTIVTRFASSAGPFAHPFGSPFGSLIVAILFGLGGVAAAEETTAIDSAKSLASHHDRFASEVAPILEEYCVFCHTQDDPSGSISLEGMNDPAELLGAFRTWQKIVRTQENAEMPPPDMEQPTAEQRKVLSSFGNELAESLDEAEPFDPGPAIFRRLNRHQYANTVRDLFGIDFDAAAAVGLPEDQKAFGYDTIAAALDIPPVLMEKYVNAADEILARAVVTRPDAQVFEAEELPIQTDGELPTDHRDGFPVPPPTEKENGYLKTRMKTVFPLSTNIAEAGNYALKVRAWRHGKKRPDLTVKVNGAVQRILPIVALEEKPETVEVPLTLPEGQVEIEVVFSNPYHGASWEKEKRFLTLAVDRLELVGPVARVGVRADPEAHDRIFVSQPGDDTSPREAATEIITRFGLRAFRRPLTEPERERFLTLFELAQSRGKSFEISVRLMLKAALLSPHFLFRIEEEREPDGHYTVYEVDGYEMASRLSYFLWSSMPDEELFRLAGEDKLDDPQVLRQQVERMLTDEKSEAFINDFFAQWLQLEELDHALPSQENFPEFDAEMKASMRGEVVSMVQHLVREGQPVTDLIDADYSFIDRTLRGYYRMDGHNERGKYKKVDINKRRNPERGGLLGMGAILSMTSHVSRNSPTQRGNWILTVMLGDPPPPPPANVEQISEDEGSGEAARTFRELLAKHASQSSSCGGCHKKMDPLGFALDNFNPIGKWETKREGEPIDATGVLPDGRTVSGAVELKELLMSEKDRFVRNLVEQMMVYGLGRNLGYYDRPAVARIMQAVQQDDYSMKTLIAEVIQSYPFRHRKNSTATEAVSLISY